MSKIFRSRLELHEALSSLMDEVLGENRDKKHHLYFQPPVNIQMRYPCIVYTRADLVSKSAGNGKYIRHTRYSLTVIDRDPDSRIIEKVADLPMCSYDRHYKADGLNHDVFQIYI